MNKLILPRCYMGLKWLCLILACGLSQVIQADDSETNSNTVTFGIVPQQSAHKLVLTWQPLMRLISKETGFDVQFKTAPSIPEFEKRLLNSSYDIAYMNPYHFTVFAETPGYGALVHAKDKKIKGIIVVSKDSELTKLSDLKGLRLAFPAPAAFAASVIPRATLQEQNIDITPKYVQTHDSVYLSIEKGLYPAGGGIQRTFNRMPETVRSRLRILWTSPGYTPHAIASRPGLSMDMTQKLERAFLALDQTPQGKEALSLLGVVGFQKAVREDWDDVRALNIEQLKDM